MLRLLFLTVLVAMGAAFAFNAFGSCSRVLSYNRNAATIAITSFLYDNDLTALYTLEQHVLHYLSLGPHAFVLGLLFSFVVRRDFAMIGVAFWATYSAFMAALLFREASNWESLYWYSMIPDSVGIACTVPLYLLGVFTGLALRCRAFPRFSISDLLLTAIAVAVLCVASLSRSNWLPPTAFAMIACWLVLRFAPGRQAACNKPMHWSGGGAFFRLLANFSPPPSDV